MVSFAALWPRATSNAPATGVPISVPATQLFEGTGGSWSTFYVNAGSPPQSFRVLPATNGAETWLPTPLGCEIKNATNNCGNSRGVVLTNGTQALGFTSNTSSTYQVIESGQYDLIMEQDLGLTGAAYYGTDTVGFGIANGLGQSPGPSLPHQTIAGISTPDFWLGFFPLSQKASNFTASYPSYLTNLASQAMIPSRSFGYTAGAQYQAKGALGSLTLGGYDASKIVSGTNMSFTFASDDSKSFTVGVQSITAQRTLQGTVAPLSSGILALIDSGVPELWLPADACALFESAFGLNYDSNTELYLVNETVHSQLQNLNSSVTLTLGNDRSGGPTISIELPYAAFDLQIGYPTYVKTGNYFPLRRAANSSQFVLGRTFLQQAYLTVDYERSNFTVGQTSFASGPSKIIPIISPNASAPTPISGSPSTAVHLSSNAIAGITIAITASFFLLCVLFYYVLQRYRYRRHQKPQKLFPSVFVQEPEDERGDSGLGIHSTPLYQSNVKHEMPSASPVPSHLFQNHWSRRQHDAAPQVLEENDNDDRSPNSDGTYSEELDGEQGSSGPSKLSDLISPISRTTRSHSRSTTNELETPVAAASATKHGFRQMRPLRRQELYGSDTAAEVHTSIWGAIAEERSSKDARQKSDSSISAPLSRSASDTSGGSGTIGIATMAPIYELSAEAQLGGVRIKPILRQHRTYEGNRVRGVWEGNKF